MTTRARRKSYAVESRTPIQPITIVCTTTLTMSSLLVMLANIRIAVFRLSSLKVFIAAIHNHGKQQKFEKHCMHLIDFTS